MIAFLSADGNLPFSIALLVMLCIALLEGVGTLLGAGLSGFLDTLLPDADLDAPDLDQGGGLTGLLGWLRVGQVPVLMLLVIFLTAFGLIGLGVQSFVSGLAGAPLPGSIAAIPAALFALPLVRAFGGLLARIMPRDETDAVAEQSFIGRVAVVTLGRATPGNPAQAKLQDSPGQTHYVMVEPDGEECFETGTCVVLVEGKGATFRAIRNESAALTD